MDIPTLKNFVGGQPTAVEANGELEVPAPVAYFPFTGWKDSFFGDLHATGKDGVEFYTERKVVIERWPNP